MNHIATPTAPVGEIAAIETVLHSSFRGPNEPKRPCPDRDHLVAHIDVAGPAAAAIVEFTDCSGASFSDLYVLQKQGDQWAISQKVWDSHAHS